MDAMVMKKASELAEELAGQATTLEDLNGVMRSLMKSALERMLNTELEVHQRRLAGFDEKILALYAKGMTTRDIQDIMKQLYDVEVSPMLISEITADLDEEVKAWQTRRLDAIYPILFLDGLVVHIRSESGHVRNPSNWYLLKRP